MLSGTGTMPGRKPPVPVLISAEHASCSVPDEWAGLFDGHAELLQSHRGWDPGTPELAAALSAAFRVPLLAGEVTRLLVDLNRSSGHRQHFSEFTRALSAAEQAELVKRYWQPHWSAYREHIERAPSRLVHLACHSFTPIMNGQLRNADIGLLYDPCRAGEQALARRIAEAIRALRPALKARMNYPYRGTANGMGQQHRRWFPESRLLTLELEINTRLLERPDWSAVLETVVEACVRAVRRA